MTTDELETGSHWSVLEWSGIMVLLVPVRQLGRRIGSGRQSFIACSKKLGKSEPYKGSSSADHMDSY